MQKEIFKPIKDYEGLYDISETGKVYSHRSKRTLKRCGDEYGFHIVRLTKDKKAKNHKVFDLWKEAFSEYPVVVFKGAKTVKYL
jgi:hypothetical protein